MAEKIEIFKLEIDLDAAVQAASDLKSEADDLKASLEILKKSGDTSSATYVKLKGSLDNVNKEYRESQKQVQQITSLQGKNIKSIKDARTALSLVNVQWAKQTKLYGANSKEVTALSKKKLELTDRLKELESAAGDTSRNVGNYSESILDAAGKNTIFNQALAIGAQIMSLTKPVVAALKLQIDGIGASYLKAATASRTFSGAQKASAITTNLLSVALKIFKLALIATGIGAIVVLIGSLVAWFSRTQKGIDFVNVALAALGAFFDVIIDRLAAFGGAVAKFFSGDMAGGFADMKAALSGIGDEIQREIDLAIKLEKVLQDVAKAEVNLDIRRAAANTRLKELNKLAEDVSKTEAERLAATQEFAKIEEGLVSQEVSNQEKRVAAMLGFAVVTEEVRDTIRKIGQEGVSLDALGISESTLEDAKEFRDEVTKLFQLQTTSFELQTTNQNKLNIIQNTIRNKRIADAKQAEVLRKKATDAAIKENETLLKLFVEQNKGKVESLEKGLSDLEIILAEELDILEQKLAAEKLTREEFNLEVLKAKNRFLEAETNLVVEFAEKELQAVRDKNQSKIDADSILTDALVSEEQRRLDLIAEERRKAEKVRFDEGILSEQEYNAAIDAVNEENRLAKEEINQELKEQKAEADAIEFENEQALRVERDGQIFQARLLELDRIKEAEIAAARKVGADTSSIDKKFAIIRAKIKEDETQAKLRLQQDLFGGIAQLLGKETLAGKAAGIAQATINTFQGVTEVWRNKSILPEPLATINKAVQTAVVLGSGLSAVRKIASTNVNVPKGAKGLTVKGPSHAQGGVPLFDGSGNKLAEVEGNENLYVVNKRASGLINSLSHINQATGGIPLSQATRYGVSGGLIERTVSSGAQRQQGAQTIDLAVLSRMIGEEVGAQMENLPPQFVAVTDIRNEDAKFTEVLDGASQ